MLKRRVAAIEKRLASLGGATEKPRLVFRFGDRTEPPGEKDEAQEREKDGPIVFIMPRPSPPGDERVLRFDFAVSGNAGRMNEKTSDVTDSYYPTEGEKK